MDIGSNAKYTFSFKTNNDLLDYDMQKTIPASNNELFS